MTKKVAISFPDDLLDEVRAPMMPTAHKPRRVEFRERRAWAPVSFPEWVEP